MDFNNFSIVPTDELFTYLKLILKELQSRMISLEDYLYS
jgi:hypothetical protein